MSYMEAFVGDAQVVYLIPSDLSMIPPNPYLYCAIGWEWRDFRKDQEVNRVLFLPNSSRNWDVKLCEGLINRLVDEFNLGHKKTKNMTWSGEFDRETMEKGFGRGDPSIDFS